MKYISKILVLLFVTISFSLSAQVIFEKVKSITPLRVVKTASGYGESESLKSIIQKPRPRFRKYKKIPNKIRRFEYTNPYNLPIKKDAVRQNRKGRSPSLSTIQSWNGISELSQGVMPPDPSGAVGKNHYVQMVNTAMQIFDKTGNSLWGPTSLGSVFPESESDGDPIVLYDKFADRWFISQFQIENNKILIAIIEKYKGGPVGLNTIATVVGEEAGTIEEVYEPFLVQQGYLVRTSRGRMVTDMAYKHLNKPRTDSAQQEIF